VPSPALPQSPSAGKSTSPSPSLSTPSLQAGTPSSVGSVGSVQLGSAGQSRPPAPSLSRPSAHWGGGGLLSSLSVELVQPGSPGKSIRPSPSLSKPSAHSRVGTTMQEVDGSLRSSPGAWAVARISRPP
jgi:hypothetical protein